MLYTTSKSSRSFLNSPSIGANSVTNASTRLITLLFVAFSNLISSLIQEDPLKNFKTYTFENNNIPEDLREKFNYYSYPKTNIVPLYVGCHNLYVCLYNKDAVNYLPNNYTAKYTGYICDRKNNIIYKYNNIEEFNLLYNNAPIFKN